MVVSVIIGHPQTGSFNHAIAQTTFAALEAAGHEVLDHDLCAEGFEAGPYPAGEADRSAALPPRPIATHCEEIASADGIVIVHPNWWGQPPAIAKGWVDRVLRVDVAYKFEEGDNGEGIPSVCCVREPRWSSTAPTRLRCAASATSSET